VFWDNFLIFSKSLHFIHYRVIVFHRILRDYRSLGEKGS